MTGIFSDDDSLPCPTCGARQSATTVECRRCRCDLTLVLAVRQAARELHWSCLKHLGSGFAAEALHCARRRHELCPDDTSRRLVAVALVCLERFDEAVKIHASRS